MPRTTRQTHKARAKAQEIRSVKRAAKRMTRPSRTHAFIVGAEWLDESGVGELLDPDDGDAVLTTLVDLLLGFAAEPSGSPAR